MPGSSRYGMTTSINKNFPDLMKVWYNDFGAVISHFYSFLVIIVTSGVRLLGLPFAKNLWAYRVP